MEIRSLYKTFMVFSAVAMVGGVAWVLLSALNPSMSRSEFVLQVDVSGLAPGDLKYFSSPSKHRIMVLRRTKEDLENLRSLSDHLKDPMSERSRQPAEAKNPFRSVNPEYFVAYTHAERLPYWVEYMPGDLAFMGYSSNRPWFGGFVNRAEGEIYDKAGRVYAGSSIEEKNLAVPEYRFISRSTLLVTFLGEKT